MPYNNIEFELTPAQKSALQAKVADLITEMTFLVNLTKKEKRAGQKGHNKYSFVKSALDYANNNTNILPPILPLNQWQKDVKLHDDLMPILGQVKVLYEAMDDTLYAIRMEMNKAAMDFLKIAVIASKSNVPGTTDMVADLKSKLNKPYKARKKKSSE